MIDTEVETFFRDKAFAYSQGRLRYLSCLFETPTVFAIGTQRVRLETHLDVEKLFETYRLNLLKQKYHKTVADVLHSEFTYNEACRCLVTYRNLNHEGDVISMEHGSYFLKHSSEGHLRINFVEFLDEARADLLPQLTLHQTSCSAGEPR